MTRVVMLAARISPLKGGGEHVVPSESFAKTAATHLSCKRSYCERLVAAPSLFDQPLECGTHRAALCVCR